MRPLRRAIQRHACTARWCVTCELRFVFDFLAAAPSLPPAARAATCQNLTRALAFWPEAKRAGLLHPCTLDPARRLDMMVRGGTGGGEYCDVYGIAPNVLYPLLPLLPRISSCVCS